jgi:hypothetical protein
MAEHELLMRHAREWATAKKRVLHEDVLAEVLELRDRYDDLPYGAWPAGSAERLLLTTWPAYGGPPPDQERLRETLDTFWGFLRATGRMSSRSATPAELRKEAKRSLPKMAAAYEDPAHHSQGRVLQQFGSDIGIDLDGAESIEELQARLDQIHNAWNALPQSERERRMPDPSPKSARGAEMTADLHGLDPRTAGLPAWPEVDPLDEPDDVPLEGGDLARAAEDARGSGFVRDCLRLAAWVGDGREATSRGLLRPAVAREAYQELDLWPWERQYNALLYAPMSEVADDPAADAVLAEAALNAWRSAGDCLPLDRLFYPAEQAGLIEQRGRKVHRGKADPATDEEWRDVTLILLTGLCLRLGDYSIEPLAGMLLIGTMADEPVPLDAIRAWWESRCPDALREIDFGWQDRLDTLWYHFADCGLWTIRGDEYVLTDLGRDFTIVFINASEEGFFGEQ